MKNRVKEQHELQCHTFNTMFIQNDKIKNNPCKQILLLCSCFLIRKLTKAKQNLGYNIQLLDDL